MVLTPRALLALIPPLIPSPQGKPKDVDEEEKDTDASSASAGAGAGVGSSDTANMNFMHKNAFQDPPSGNTAASGAFDGPPPPGGLERAYKHMYVCV